MATATRETTRTSQEEPRPFHWTVEQYEQMAEMGWFNDIRTELLEGEIITMTPIGSRHATVTNVIRVELERAFGIGYFARVQMPLRMVPFASEPEPDIAIVAGSMLDYLHENPTTAELVVEVADATLATDRVRKAAMYAAAGVPEYWIANLQQNQLEVHRSPVYSARGSRYEDKRILMRNEEVSPFGASNVKIKIADLLP